MHTLNNSWQNSIRAGLACFLALLVVACGENPTLPGGKFNSDSWRTLVPADCQTYFDGCNNCTRDPQTDETVCTKEVCEVYQAPRCLDGEAGISVTAIIGPRLVKYRCAENKRFTMHYGEYSIAKKKVKLKDTQAVFVDSATGIAEVMTMQPSTIGEAYVSGATTVITKDKDAVVKKYNNTYYANCSVQEPN